MRAVIVLGLVLGCNRFSAVEGDGTVKDETRQVAPFTQVAVDGAMHAYITAGAPQSVVLRSDGNIVPLIATDVSDLRLHVHATKPIAPTTGPIATIAGPAVTSLSVSGASVVEMKGVSGDELSLDASGAAHIALVGTAKKVQIDAAGAAMIDASHLQAEDVTVTSSGAGTVDVSATGVLDVSIAGAATVHYHGTPRVIHKSIAGAGSLEAAP